MNQPCRTIECDEGIVVKIYPDDSAENPIVEFDGEANVSVWHRHYDFGNNHDFNTPKAFEEACDQPDNQPAGCALDQSPVILLPVYLYDHSGLTVNTTGFSCLWDSGQVGWVWVTLAQAQQRWGTTDEDQILDRLRGTVKLLDHYLTGNVYGFVIEDREGKRLDSCWGFYGDPNENVIPEAQSAAEYYVEKAAENRLVVETVARKAVETYQRQQQRRPAL